ncbi:diguanylate cyclase [Caldimonas brevitalea]|uniref:Diguanylate cyclase n=1 Tax=Caldimonas brevitalea TaxID=413882 RepID=A0A0G3BKS3_9BURK|nr:diguanylate cyclase [Caldimonas brevitalea]
MPHRFLLSRVGLKARLAFAVAAAMLLLLAAVVAVGLHVLERDMRKSITDYQTTVVRHTREELDEKIGQRKDAMGLAAAVLSRRSEGGVPTAEQFRRHMSERPVLGKLFDEVFVIDAQGALIADAPQRPGRIGRSFADRDYFVQAMAGRTSVSPPLFGRATKEPGVVVAAPLRDAEGAVVGALVGVLYLNGESFLAKLGNTRIGKGGYFLLMTRDDKRQVVMHPQRDRIGSAMDNAAHLPHARAATQGYDTTLEGTTRDGTPALFTFQPLQSVPWSLAAVYPSQEAYAALEDREADIFWAAALLAVGAGLAAWLISARLLRPLVELKAEMQIRRHDPDAAARQLSVSTPELAEVVAAYDELMLHKRKSDAALRESEDRIRGILTHAPHAFISIDQHNRVVEWNRQAEHLFGWEREEVIGRNLSALIVPEDQRAAHDEGMRRFAQAGTGPVINRRRELEALHRSGRLLSLEMSVAAVRGPGGYCANAFIQDIAERKQQDSTLRESQKRLRLITDNLPALVCHIDRLERFTFANAHVARMFGVEPAFLLGKTVSEVRGRRAYEAMQPHFDAAWKGKSATIEHEVTARGEHRCLETNLIPDHASDGSVQGLYAMSFDVTERKAATARLEQLARSDTLTGLPNRHQFNERLAEAVARGRRSGKPLALMYLDVDHFKSINDNLGHGIGDEVLQEFGRRLSACVRATDTVARLGGDEFTVILEGLNSAQEADQVAEKILQAVRRPFMLGPRSLAVTTSIGMAACCDGQTSPEQLLAQADQALYQTKAQGRDGYSRRQGAASGATAAAAAA